MSGEQTGLQSSLGGFAIQLLLPAGTRVGDSTPAKGVPIGMALPEPRAAPQLRDQHLWEALGDAGAACEAGSGSPACDRAVTEPRGLCVPSPDPRWPQSGFCEASPPALHGRGAAELGPGPVAHSRALWPRRLGARRSGGPCPASPAPSGPAGGSVPPEGRDSQGSPGATPGPRSSPPGPRAASGSGPAPQPARAHAGCATNGLRVHAQPKTGGWSQQG